MARGVLWMSAARFSVRGLGLVSTALLARLLGPPDFGLIAMASAVVALGEVIRAFSFDTALIHEQGTAREQYDTAWTLNVLLGGAIGLALALVAPVVAALYGDPRIKGILPFLALAFFVEGLANVGVVDFRKNLDFQRDFRLMVLQKIAGFGVTVTLALAFRNYWALVFGSLFSSVAGVGLSYAMHSFRPRFSLRAYHKLVGFSKWMMFSNFTAFLKNKTSDILLGALGGPQVAGVFTVAYDVANLATTELVAPINRAVMPGYVKLADDSIALRGGFSKVLGFIALVACPAALGIAALSDHIVELVLGPQWHAVAGLVQVLAVASAFTALLTNSISVYVAVGRPDLIALMSAIHTAALLPMLVVGIVARGADGAAWAHLLHVALIATPSTYYLLVRYTPVTLGDIFGSLWRPAVAAGIMYAGVRLLFHGGPSAASGEALTVLLGVLTGAGLYAASVLLLWRGAGAPPGPEHTLIESTLTRIRRRAPVTSV
ncbi:MAG TPA: lipopolysaccharide biosynthesis protein [Methylomirabilota bacterium]|jgi:O-antigen/teichoic acid export membrane protein